MSADESSPAVLPTRWGRAVYWAAGVIIGLMALNWVLAVARFQVNGLYSDQWNFCEAILRGEGPVGLFTWQHTPHRQGLAFVLTAWIWEWSGWDTRVEAFWGVGWLVVIAVGILAWKARLTGRLNWRDLWLPVAALAMRQFETVITVPNLSHSVFPLVLLLAMGWIMAKPLGQAQWAVLGGIGLIAVFTGFGLFVAGALGWVAGLRLVQNARDRRWRKIMGPGLAAIWLVVAAVWFLWDYKLSSSSAGGSFLHWPWWDYPRFVAVMLASRMDLTGGGALVYLAGSLMLIVAVAAWANASWRLGREEAPSPALMSAGLWLTVGLGYAVITAVGRVHLGVMAGEAPRYATLMVSVWLGLLAWSWASQNWLWRGLAVVLGWSMVVAPWFDLRERPVGDWPGTMGMSDASRVAIEYSNNQKIEWISIWEETGDWRVAEAQVPGAIHGQAVEVQLGEKIDFMRKNRLSFAAEPESPWSWLPWWNPKGITWARAMGGLNQQWMAERAILVVDGRLDELLNLRLAWKATDLAEEAELEVMLGDKKARLSYQELLAGVSIDAPVERGKLTLRSVMGTVPLNPPIDPREGSFLVVEPTLTATPEYEYRGWAEEAGELWAEQALEIVRGFYGWEGGGTFGWTEAELELEVRSLAPRYLNVSIQLRFAQVNQGPVKVVVDGETHPLAWSPDGLRFSVELSGGRAHRILLINEAGMMSPREVGRSGDSRQLALRINRLTLDEAPVSTLLSDLPRVE